MERMHDYLAVPLAGELKKLVGWGADSKRLVLCPTLKRLANVDRNDKSVTAGYIILKYLTAAVDAIDPHEFRGMWIEADRLRRAFRLLLKIEGSGQDASNRRTRVMEVLGVVYSVETWKKPAGPERELMQVLADAMITRSISLEG
jgi:hypothetical protein